MATTKAFVTYANDTTALVKTLRPSSCEGCSEQNSCIETECKPLTNTTVLNKIGAKKGDTVILNYESSSLLKIAFLVYVFPIIALILGAITGENLAKTLSMNNSAAAAIFAFCFFFIAVAIIKIVDNKITKKDKYTASIEKIIGKNAFS